MYVNKPPNLSFICGGSLVNTKSVVTAAHCVRTTNGDHRPSDIVLWLGRHNLGNWNEAGAISSNVERVMVHPDFRRYSSESYDADIAILIMQRQVTYTQYVRPICLWPTRDDITIIEGSSGTVVGWGEDNTGNPVSNVPNKVELPIVNSLTCVQTSSVLLQLISNRTFCAGSLQGEGPCHGDSG